ncbi:MAG: hypothetical protein WBD20_04185 [Pirellulaceae bacterium]
MRKFKFAMLLGLLFVPCAMVGCGESKETTVIEAAPEMTAEEEATYEEQSMGSANDQDQN